ncbi:hypothetical protein GEMRC1_007642 [Eukaryota sp. GEM-RC1]
MTSEPELEAGLICHNQSDPTLAGDALRGGRNSLVFVALGVFINLLARFSSSSLAQLSAKLLSVIAYFIYLLFQFSFFFTSISFSSLVWLFYFSLFSAGTATLLFLSSDLTSLFPVEALYLLEKALFAISFLSSIPAALLIDAFFLSRFLINTSLSAPLSLIIVIVFVLSLISGKTSSFRPDQPIFNKVQQMVVDALIYVLPVVSLVIHGPLYNLRGFVLILSLSSVVHYYFGSKRVQKVLRSPQNIENFMLSIFSEINFGLFFRFILPFSIVTGLFPGLFSEKLSNFRVFLIVIILITLIPLLLNLVNRSKSSSSPSQSKLIAVLTGVLVSLLTFAFFGATSPSSAFFVTFLGSCLIGFLFLFVFECSVNNTLKRHLNLITVFSIGAVYALGVIKSWLYFSHLELIDGFVIMLIPVPVAVSIGLLIKFSFEDEDGEDTHVNDLLVLILSASLTFVESLLKSLPHEHALLPSVFVLLTSAIFCFLAVYPKLRTKITPITRAFLISLGIAKLILAIPVYGLFGDVFDWFLRVTVLTITVIGSITDLEKVATTYELVTQRFFFSFLASFCVSLVLLPALFFNFTGDPLTMKGFFYSLIGASFGFFFISTFSFLPSFATFERFGDAGLEVIKKIRKVSIIVLLVVACLFMIHFATPAYYMDSVEFSKAFILFGLFVAFLNICKFGSKFSDRFSRPLFKSPRFNISVKFLNSVVFCWVVYKHLVFEQEIELAFSLLILFGLFFSVLALFSSLPHYFSNIYISIIPNFFSYWISSVCFVLSLFKANYFPLLVTSALIMYSLQVLSSKTLKKSKQISEELIDICLILSNIELISLFVVCTCFVTVFFTGFSVEVFLIAFIMALMDPFDNSEYSFTDYAKIVLNFIPLAGILSFVFDLDMFVSRYLLNLSILIGLSIWDMFIINFYLFESKKINQIVVFSSSLLCLIAAILTKSSTIVIFSVLVVVKTITVLLRNRETLVLNTRSD